MTEAEMRSEVARAAARYVDTTDALLTMMRCKTSVETLNSAWAAHTAAFRVLKAAVRTAREAGALAAAEPGGPR